MKRYLPGVLAALGILILGLGISWLASLRILPNPTFSASYEVDLAGLASRAGFTIGASALVIASIVIGIQQALERKILDEQEAQVSAQKRFFQRLDHELKNPLTIIRLGIVNLQQSPNLDHDQAGSLERISQQVQRLQKLVVDLRLLSELDQGSIEHKPVALKELLEEAVVLSSQALEPSRKIVLNIPHLPWPVSDVWGDRDLLVLVFRNLLDNAIKFTTPDEQVEVRVTEDGRMAIVDVVDTGHGIPTEEIPHIFEELYRGQNARGVPGSGLGLKLVERIVQLHDGTVLVRSKPEMGTVFTVRLHLAPESA
jgi:two-component system, OmpR family, sensor kinase